MVDGRVEQCSRYTGAPAVATDEEAWHRPPLRLGRIRRPERRVPPSRTGWTEGELAALEMSVKDGSRFEGGWAYFDFGRSAEPAEALPHERCASCHSRHAALDNVFLQFYPQLRGR